MVLARPFFFITTGYFFDLEIILSISRNFFDESITRKQTPVKVQGRLSPPEERMTKAYPSNLTWEQWELIAELFPKEKPGGRPRTVAMYAIVNAILYG